MTVIFMGRRWRVVDRVKLDRGPERGGEIEWVVLIAARFYERPHENPYCITTADRLIGWIR